MLEQETSPNEQMSIEASVRFTSAGSVTLLPPSCHVGVYMMSIARLRCAFLAIDIPPTPDPPPDLCEAIFEP